MNNFETKSGCSFGFLSFFVSEFVGVKPALVVGDHFPNGFNLEGGEGLANYGEREGAEKNNAGDRAGPPDPQSRPF